MKFNKAYKFRLYPNEQQEELINKTFGCCRFLYNRMLAERISVYEQLKDDKESLYQHKYKTEKQYKEEFSWLTEVDSIALDDGTNYTDPRNSNGLPDSLFNDFYKDDDELSTNSIYNSMNSAGQDASSIYDDQIH